MAGRKTGGRARLAAKLLFAGMLGVITLHVSGLVARAPAPVKGETRPAAAPATSAPQSRPAVPLGTAAAKPAAAPASSPTTGATPAGGFIVKRVLRIEGPFRHGDYVWDDKGVPAGPVVITIDLAAQTLSVFRDGYEIGAAVILYGADNMPTPTGTFPITQKDADHVSNLYDAPMPYMLRLTNDGVSIHGSDVELHAATHGCIGVPLEFARRLFGQAKLGDPVIITNGKMMDVDGARVG